MKDWQQYERPDIILDGLRRDNAILKSALKEKETFTSNLISAFDNLFNVFTSLKKEVNSMNDDEIKKLYKKIEQLEKENKRLEDKLLEQEANRQIEEADQIDYSNEIEVAPIETSVRVSTTQDRILKVLLKRYKTNQVITKAELDDVGVSYFLINSFISCGFLVKKERGQYKITVALKGGKYVSTK